MKKSDELKQLRKSKMDEMRALLDATKAEKRELKEDEGQRFDTLKNEIEALDVRIKRQEDVEAQEARLAAAAFGASADKGEAKEKANLNKRASLLKLISKRANNESLDGAEAELVQEGEKQMRLSGRTAQGVALPTWAFEERATIAATGADDGVLTEPDGGFIEALRAGTVIGSLGARAMGNLVGEVVMPKLVGGSATWEGETDSNADMNASFTGVKLSPTRLSGYVDVTKQFVNMFSYSAEQILRQDILNAIAEAVDAAAINGSGTGQPEGILNFSGLSTVTALGANGAVPTWANMVALESAVAASNALRGNLHYLTTPGMRGKLKTVTKDSGSGQFIWAGTEVNGYGAAASSLVPNDLDKGSSTGVCHAIIFGDFSQLIIGQWGAIDLVVDNVTQARIGVLRMVVNGYFDVKARHEAAFAAYVDALTA